MDVIDRLIAYYKSIGWWAARFEKVHVSNPSHPDMIATHGGKCIFISRVFSDRTKPISALLGKDQAKALAAEKALNLYLACEDGDDIRVFQLTWEEQKRLASGLRLRDLEAEGIVVKCP